MRYAYSAVHGESGTIWAIGDDNYPQALTVGSSFQAQRIATEANSAEAYRKRTGNYPQNIGADTATLIRLCNEN